MAVDSIFSNKSSCMMLNWLPSWLNFIEICVITSRYHAMFSHSPKLRGVVIRKLGPSFELPHPTIQPCGGRGSNEKTVASVRGRGQFLVARQLRGLLLYYYYLLLPTPEYRYGNGCRTNNTGINTLLVTNTNVGGHLSMMNKFSSLIRLISLF